MTECTCTNTLRGHINCPDHDKDGYAALKEAQARHGGEARPEAKPSNANSSLTRFKPDSS